LKFEFTNMNSKSKPSSLRSFAGGHELKDGSNPEKWGEIHSGF